MITNLKPYPEYRDSGVPWLGEVPEHWGQRRMKFLFKERVQKGFPDEPLLAATQSKGVVRKSDYGSRTVTAVKDLHLLKLVEEGDFVISLRSFQGGIELAHCRGIISPAYTVLTPREEALIRYFRYFLKSQAFIDSMTLFVTGIREGQNIDYSRLARAFLPVPGEEAAAIVRFLDHANHRLEKAIRAKQKVIKLLNEQKQVIIHRAVTRGLDPNVRLKPSDSDWLGDIPEHWQVLQLRRISSLVTSGSRGWAKHYHDQGDVFLQSGNLGRAMRLNLGTVQHVRLPAGAEGMRTKVSRDDLLVCITGALTGNVVHVDAELPTAYVNQHVALVRIKKKVVNSRFVAYALHSDAGQRQFKTGEYGGTKQGLGLGEVKSVEIAFPPSEEQNRIVEGLDRELSRLDEPISRTEREITLLREYRTRLTADVVTGKLDIREAAARLLDNEEPTAWEESAKDAEGWGTDESDAIPEETMA